ncbi:MAG: hypothetical protein QGH45_11165, partial [Myxococcota bacterium]|nr:hypothetical protein [Myxococcota bacterium]
MVARRTVAGLGAAALALALGALATCGDPGATAPVVEGEYPLASDIRPYLWNARVSALTPGLSVEPGGSWQATFEVEADLREYNPRHGRFTGLIVALHAQRRHDEDGHYLAGDRTVALTSRFSTTGMPLERFDGWPSLRLLHDRGGSPFEAVARFDLPADQGDLASVHRISGTLDAQLPADAPAGYYEPRLLVYA